jgi:hypothetical protein
MAAALLPFLIPAAASLLGAGISAVGAGMSAAEKRELDKKNQEELLALENKKIMMEQANADRNFGMEGYKNFIGMVSKNDSDARLRAFNKGLSALATPGRVA